MGRVKGQQFFNSLEFDDNAIFNHEVDSIPSFETDSLVNDWEAHLVLKLQAINCELVPKTALVGAFQHTGAEGAVDFDRSLKNSLSDRLVKHWDLLSVSSASSVVALLHKQAVDQT